MSAPSLSSASSDWIFRDNGFTALAPMQKAHAEMVNFCADALEGQRVASILDLGCGNGLLAMQMKQRLSATRACGLDLNGDAISRANILMNKENDQFVNAAISDVDKDFGAERFDLIILMAGRFSEAQKIPGATEALEAYLRSHTDLILFYKYDDWIEATGPLTRCPLTGANHSFTPSPCGSMGLVRL